MRIEWARSARDDLKDLRDYIAKDSPSYAQRFIERIIAAVESLPDQPQRGRRVPEADRDDVRELLFQNYRIIYMLRSETPLRVLSGARGNHGLVACPWIGGNRQIGGHSRHGDRAEKSLTFFRANPPDLGRVTTRGAIRSCCHRCAGAM